MVFGGQYEKSEGKMVSHMDIPFLTSGESKVYESLVDLGDSSIGNILKRSRVSHSKIYDILKRLESKGLVSCVVRNGRQVFAPSNPSRLSVLVREERERLESTEKDVGDTIKRLSARMNSSSSSSILRSFEGFRGVKTVVDGTLDGVKKGDEIFILGSPKLWGERFGGYMIAWEKERLKKGAKCFLLLDSDTPSWNFDWWKESKKKGLTFTKRASFKAPSYLIITKNSVVTINVGEQLLAVLVKNDGIAERYKEFFLELWKKS